ATSTATAPSTAWTSPPSAPPSARSSVRLPTWPSWTAPTTARSTAWTSPPSETVSASPSDRPTSHLHHSERTSMLRHRFAPALALGVLLLTPSVAPAQIVYEFVDATTGLAQNAFAVPVGGTLPIQVFLHELTPGAPMFNSAGGLGSGAVRLTFANPPGVAGL